MATTPQRCAKCGGGMDQGFVLDTAHGHQVVSQWVPGAPMKSFWVGTKVQDEKVLPIGTFRCSSCGYLESYAQWEFGAK